MEVIGEGVNAWCVFAECCVMALLRRAGVSIVWQRDLAAMKIYEDLRMLLTTQISQHYTPGPSVLPGLTALRHNAKFARDDRPSRGGGGKQTIANKSINEGVCMDVSADNDHVMTMKDLEY